MSTLKDLLRRISRGEPSPLGFAASTRKAASSMLLVALISERYDKSAKEAVDAGAEALLLTTKSADRDVAAAAGAADGRALGVLSDDIAPEAIASLQKGGADFVVIGGTAPAAVLQNDDVSFVLQVRDELTDVQLRTIEPLSVRAIYVEQEIGPLTIDRQMELQRISGLARKPLFVRVGAGAAEADLLTLRDSGVAMVGVDLKERGATGVAELRARIEQLPRRKAKRDDTEVSLPRASATAPEYEDDDDDEF
jgi:hypothetical protein